MDHQESGWVQDAQRGDTGAFDRLVRRHERRVLHAISGILGSGPDVYDVYQDTLVRAFSKLGTFRFESSYATWVTRIAINSALNERRRRKPERFQELDESLHGGAGRSVSASGPLEQAELRQSTERAMLSLSERERAVFVLKHQHGYKLREIGDMLGCAEGTIKNYLFRATRKLRDRLEPEYKALS